MFFFVLLLIVNVQCVCAFDLPCFNRKPLKRPDCLLFRFKVLTIVFQRSLINSYTNKTKKQVFLAIDRE